MSTILTFGKFKGKDVSQVDDSYLLWCLKNFDRSHWLEVVTKELLVRNLVSPGSPDSSGMVTTVRIKLPNGRYEEHKVPPLNLGQIDPSQVQSTEMAAVDASDSMPEPGKVGAALKHSARLGGKLFMSDIAYNTLYSLYADDLAMMPIDLRSAACSLAQEAILYGTLSGEKWITNGKCCVVSLDYLQLKWDFSVDQGAYPQLREVTPLTSQQ